MVQPSFRTTIKPRVGGLVLAVLSWSIGLPNRPNTGWLPMIDITNIRVWPDLRRHLKILGVPLLEQCERMEIPYVVVATTLRDWRTAPVLRRLQVSAVLRLEPDEIDEWWRGRC